MYTYNRSSLECWNPWSIQQMDQRGNIQHKLKSLAYKHHMNYNQQLIDFDLPFVMSLAKSDVC